MVMSMRREGGRENDLGKASRERMQVAKKERDMNTLLTKFGALEKKNPHGI